MIFRETKLRGAYVIEPERRADDRGFFARTWCRQEFQAHGIEDAFVQRHLSVNPVRGTLRGLHYQEAPYEEGKLMQCTRGAIFDVLVDLRHDSPTFGKWMEADLTAENYRMLYAPKGVAHGFQTLRDDTEVSYLVSQYYVPQASRGIRYDDPWIGIRWPLPVSRISERDRSWPMLGDAAIARRPVETH